MRMAFGTLFREGGVPAFYRGVKPAVLGIAPYMALELASYDLLPRSIPSFLRGFMAALIATSFCYPLDTIRCAFVFRSPSAMQAMSQACGAAGVGGGVVSPNHELYREGGRVWRPLPRLCPKRDQESAQQRCEPPSVNAATNEVQESGYRPSMASRSSLPLPREHTQNWPPHALTDNSGINPTRRGSMVTSYLSDRPCSRLRCGDMFD